MKVCGLEKHFQILLIFALGILRGPFGSPDAIAAPCEVDATSHLSTELSERRSQTGTWTTVWGITWSAATAGQLSVALSTTQLGLRQDLITGAVSSSLGLVPTWIIPPQIITDPPLDACANKDEWRARLDRYAEDDRRMTSLLAHVSNVAVNLAVSLVMGIGFDHWDSAALSAAVGIPVGELMILSYPKASANLTPLSGLSFMPNRGGGAIEFSISY